MNRSWQRLHLDPPSDSRKDIALALDAILRTTLDRLEIEGRLRIDHGVTELVLPSLYQDVLEVALKSHRRAELLRLHFLEVMPVMLIEQAASRTEGELDFFHQPLDWSQLPHLK